MIYAIKLLLGLLAVLAVTFLPLRGHLARLLGTQNLSLWLKALIGATAIAFLAGRVELFMLLLAVLAWALGRPIQNDPGRTLALYLVLLLASPALKFTLEGLGDISSLIELNAPRVLSLALLLPMALTLQSRPRAPAPPIRAVLDLFVLLYFVSHVLNTETVFSVTNTARLLIGEGLDLALPYWVITRGLKPEDVRTVLGALAFSCVALAATALIEFAVSRHFYNPLQAVYGVQWQLSYALMRGDWLRSQATLPQPILLSFVLLYGVAALWTLAGRGQRRGLNLLLLALLAAGIVTTYSRGPWVGAMALAVLLWWMPRMGHGTLRTLCALVLVGLPVALLTDIGDEVFKGFKGIFGTSAADAGSIDYRHALLETAQALIAQSPWTGVPDYASHMMHLVQGEGIIDIVNAYLGITLSGGLLGLAAFLMPLLIGLHRRLMALRIGAIPEGRDADLALVALTLVVLVVLVTTSSFSVIPLLLMLLVALPPASGEDDPRRRRPGALR